MLAGSWLLNHTHTQTVRNKHELPSFLLFSSRDESLPSGGRDKVSKVFTSSNFSLL